MRKISLIGLATMSMLAFNTSAFALGTASSNSGSLRQALVSGWRRCPRATKEWEKCSTEYCQVWWRCCTNA